MDWDPNALHHPKDVRSDGGKGTLNTCLAIRYLNGELTEFCGYQADYIILDADGQTSYKVCAFHKQTIPPERIRHIIPIQEVNDYA